MSEPTTSAEPDLIAPISDGPDEASVSRVLDAPRERVFAMWTDPAHVTHWWRPEGFRSVVCERMDVRPGGGFEFRMHHENGNEYLSRNTYIEVVPPVRLVYDETCYENGTAFHQARMTIRFDDLGRRTRLIIHGHFTWLPGRDPRWTIDAMKAGWTGGWKDNLDLLVQYLATL
ncbi:SRPBCC domain-containing protein [Uliginosibacterium sp. sgz301328]|uniref:SRPBCC domain-containing protein n=1 Tax=Uliginosibacterium sp. sgz301328 TaxID=3243764 RepID=UPI00359E822D